MFAGVRTLSDLPTGEKCLVDYLTSKGADKRRMFDLGIIPGTEIKVLFKSPFGGITAYHIRGAIIAIRLEDSKKIVIKN